MFLKNIKKIYIIGIEGNGTSALACLLRQSGFQVSGSDEGDHFNHEVLSDHGVDVFHEFSQDNIPDDADLIIYSTAYKAETNPEVKSASERGLKMCSYPEALGALIREKYGIAICGAHGKTTTTAMLAFVMQAAGYEPNAIIGSKVKQFNSGFLVGSSNYLIVEADEYQNKFQYYSPKAIILNNIEYEHPDFFATPEDYLQVFVEFISKLPKSGFLVANFDDQEVKKIARVNCPGKVITYGIDNKEVNYQAYNLELRNGKQFFKVRFSDYDTKNEEYLVDEAEDLGEFAISLPGEFNVYNALGVIAASIELGLELTDIRTHIEDFLGTARRMEKIGEYKGAIIIDDYAHHPTELQVTLKTIRDLYPKKNIIAVFQSHTYTRTKQLLNEFSQSFGSIDQVIVLDVYGSAREKQGGVHAKDLVKKIKANESGKRVEYIPTPEKCAKSLKNKLGSNDVLVLLGAGEAYKVGEALPG